ncbi:MAG: alpha/beta hydrolase [Pirellulales bacterium]
MTLRRAWAAVMVSGLWVTGVAGLVSVCGGLGLIGGAVLRAADEDIFDQVEHKYAESDGVKIHYAAAGSGPLIVFIHGFPDFWYSWRHQMQGLKDAYRVCALDTRGYNLSDQPERQEDFDMSRLVADVAAVIEHEGQTKAVIVGHDWGGAIAWQFAFARPQMVERLIVVNLPHPQGLMRELATNERQIKNSEYARQFMQPDSHKSLQPEMLAHIVARDPEVVAKYVEAFRRSSLNGMMCYYRQNYPRPPYDQLVDNLPKINVPVLQFHGLKDTALDRQALNDTWEWLAADYTLVTLPDASHWAHHDSPELVTATIRWWLSIPR